MKKFIALAGIWFLAILGLVYAVFSLADSRASAGCTRVAGFTLGEGGTKSMTLSDDAPVVVTVSRVSGLSEVTEGQITVGVKPYNFSVFTSGNVQPDGIRLSATGRRFGTDTTFVLSDCRKQP